MLGFEYKRQIILVISFSATRDLVPPHIVSTSIISKTFPTNNQGETNCIKEGWDLTFGENHIGCPWKQPRSLSQTFSFLNCNHIFKF